MIISRYANRHEEYETELLQHNTPSYPQASVSVTNNQNSEVIEMFSEFIDGANLALNVDFNTLNRCNVGCVMCPPSIKIEDLGFPRDKLFVLTEDNFVKMTSGIRLNSSHFVGAYAEPLMNKELPNLISAAKKVGSFTAITTNAMLLNSEKALSLIDAGLDMISVSIHGGSKEVAEKIMRKSNFDTIRNNLLEFRNLRRKSSRNILTYFNFVGMTLNIHDFNNLLELCSEVDFENINLFSLIAGDEVVDKSLSLENDVTLLRESVLPYLPRARELGINVIVSSPYKELLFG
jgi:MoaA/NifB/PqqE/SkfB family radical SAM enzyme